LASAKKDRIAQRDDRRRVAVDCTEPFEHLAMPMRWRTA
jgi:hypothetical protein